MVHIDTKTQQAMIAAAVVLVVIILIVSVFSPWRRAAPAVSNDPVPETTETTEPPTESTETTDTAESAAIGSTATEKDDIQSEQSRHRRALLMSMASNRRTIAPPTTSAVVLAAMRTPSRSRTGSQSVDYVDSYDINKVIPAELGTRY